ncbi:MAG TPA: SMP-30/gluconolactonase/LRE family protein [Acidimicrobiia bacterium]|nr:SMP-30/gluconolactonase/LRE family protein [Acidimicrobiia bacterium]
MPDIDVLLDDLAFPEGPRWRDGAVWFSDMHAHRVVRLDPTTGDATTVAEVPTQPSGLGWLPDGRLLVVSMTDRRVLRQEPDGALVEHANLWHLAPWHCNDMVVGADGRAYVGNFGFDMYSDATPRRTNIVAVEPDGTARSVAEDLGFPNGMVITPDGATLIVGESFGGCLTAFTIAPDGSLHDRRTFATLNGAVPDGICLDVEGAVWLACPLSHRVVRVADGGDVLDEIAFPHLDTFACTLGGDDGRTLFVCTAATHDPTEAPRLRSGRIEAVRVAVPGAGSP